MRGYLLPALLVGLSLVVHAHDDDHGHGGRWAWAGVFSLEAGERYTWSCARGSSGEYAATRLEFLMLPVASADREGLAAAEELAERLWTSDAARVEPGSALPASAKVHLVVDQDTWVSTFKVHPAADGSYAVLASPHPIEFEKEFHFLRDSHGFNVEPTVSTDEAAVVSEGTLGKVLLASAVVALPSLALVAVVGPFLRVVEGFLKEQQFMSSFASGALFACAVFLLLPEGFHLASEGQTEVDATWTWGVAILSGWLLCVLIHWLVDTAFPRDHGHVGHAPEGRELAADVADEPCSIEASQAARAESVAVEVPTSGAGAEDLDTQDTAASKLPKRRQPAVNWKVASPVLVGDFWHNLVDGMILGFSAKHCGDAMTWTIVAATIAHELPQEMADFFILISKANMRWPLAAAVNFASGLSTVVGALLAYSTSMSATFQGLSLAFGGGVFLYIALTELGQQMLSKVTPSGCAIRCVAFAVGCASIGLIMADHQHCSAPGAAHGGHGGHGLEGHGH